LSVAVSKSGYTISGSPKTATIYYSGGGGDDISDFTYTETETAVTITGYIGYKSNVTIPAQINGKPVTSIGARAFIQCTSLTSVIIPNSVSSIESNVFERCSNLTSVTIPNSIISIGSFAFTSTGLTSVIIPNSVTSIGQDAFYRCNNLTSVKFEGTITADKFGSSTFGDVIIFISPFDGDLRDKYLAGGIGTYTRPNGDSTMWTKQGSSGGGGEGGTFTLTDIPSQYNGKYAILMVSALPLGGAQSVNIATDTITLVPISNGSVSLPMWKDINTNIWSRYSGNDTAAIVSVVISSLATSSLEFGDSFYSAMAADIRFTSVTFTNGGATRSWSQGEVVNVNP